MEYGILSIIPPIVAIGLAFLTKKVILSLFSGIFIGALIVAKWNPLTAIWNIIQIFWNNLEFANFQSWEKFNDSWNLFILLFLIMLGIVVVLVNRAGGAIAYGKWAGTKIKSRKGAQLSTMLLGVIIFLDDYFNCLTVGTVMRPVTDSHKISRAKLAYLIDSTAAPVCIIAPISSWVAEVISQLTIAGVGKGTLSNFNPYNVFISSIFFNSYALLTILMMVILAVKDFDYGPMAHHEYSAKFKDDLFHGEKEVASSVEKEIVPSEKGKVMDLVLPILFLIVSLICFMLWTGDFVLFGGKNNMVQAFESMNSAKALFYSGILSVIFSIVFLLSRKVFEAKELPDLFWKGFKLMLPALEILILAWAIGYIIRTDLKTGEYIVSVTKGSFPVELMPAFLFVVACIISFATGTSWGTFGIVIPIAVPILVQTSRPDLLIPMVGAVLGGAVFGDHASPISDTTIMSSTGAMCKHINHVDTQVPYAVTVASVALISALVNGYSAKLGILTCGIINAVLGVFLLYVLVNILSNRSAKKIKTHYSSL